MITDKQILKAIKILDEAPVPMNNRFFRIHTKKGIKEIQTDSMGKVSKVRYFYA